ncbi:hypothetical protein HNQ50_003866 [Silvimonas terrae]|uniref:Uncharacterized protein n=1 Tax=Silvimonas terrae TaxID=300266 RepID=A0A840RLP0_9NEIS|nr:hypothetical protein [Silvimonas terrae]MBB5193112.1 hypothetical protein [Silvimonas terrae]
MTDRLLLIGAEGYCWYLWRRGRWQAGPQAAGTLPSLPEASVLMVLDLPEEECAWINLPDLKPADRKPWLRARLQQHFPGWFCAKASMEPTAQAVLHGLAATENTTALAMAFVQSPAAHINGICFQSSLLAEAGAADAIPRLIVAQGLRGGLRHALTQKGRVLFTRLCQDEHQPEGDLVTTCRHLDEAGLLPAQLSVCIDPESGLDEAAVRTLLTQHWPDLQLAVASRFASIHPAQRSRAALLRHRAWLNGPLLVRQARQRLNHRGYWGALVLSALAIVYSALLLYLSWQMPSGIGRVPATATQSARFAVLDHAALQLLEGRGTSITRMGLTS